MRKDAKIVRKVLEISQNSRDDVNELYACYLGEKGFNVFSLAYIDIVKYIAQGRIKSIETISRLSRGAQQKHIELRGKEWGRRQKQARKVRNQIINNEYE